MNRLGFLALWLFAGALALVPVVAPSVAMANNDKPDQIGRFAGGITITQGQTWRALTSVEYSDLKSTSAPAAVLPTGLTYTEITVCNSHASNTLYFTYASLSGSSVGGTDSRSIPVGPKECRTAPIYGLSLPAISVTGSGANTTGHVTAQFVR